MTVTPEEAASLFDECRSSEALLAVEWTGGVMPDFFDATVIEVECRFDELALGKSSQLTCRQPG
jgi:hypothetical protein